MNVLLRPGWLVQFSVQFVNNILQPISAIGLKKEMKTARIGTARRQSYLRVGRQQTYILSDLKLQFENIAGYARVECAIGHDMEQ